MTRRVAAATLGVALALILVSPSMPAAAATVLPVTVSGPSRLDPPLPASGQSYTVQLTNTGGSTLSGLRVLVSVLLPGRVGPDAIRYAAGVSAQPTPVQLQAAYDAASNSTKLTGDAGPADLAPSKPKDLNVTLTPTTTTPVGRLVVSERVSNGTSSVGAGRPGFVAARDFPTEAFVDRAYRDFLHRAPDPGGMAYWTGQVLAGLSHEGLARLFAGQPEYVASLVDGFYWRTLRRPADPGGLAYWSGLIRDSTLTEAQVAAALYASDEYFQSTGGTLSGWVDALYQTLLGRTPDASGRDYWVAVAGGPVGRVGVAYAVYQSLESRWARVDGRYLSLLGRVADPGGRDFWSAVVGREGDLALAAYLAGSVEYADRATGLAP